MGRERREKEKRRRTSRGSSRRRRRRRRRRRGRSVSFSSAFFPFLRFSNLQGVVVVLSDSSCRHVMS